MPRRHASTHAACMGTIGVEESITGDGAADAVAENAIPVGGDKLPAAAPSTPAASASAPKAPAGPETPSFRAGPAALKDPPGAAIGAAIN